MTVTLQSLGIDKFSAADRLNLMHEIWVSLSNEASSTAISDAERQELISRLADHQSNPNDVVSWEEVEATLLGGQS